MKSLQVGEKFSCTYDGQRSHFTYDGEEPNPTWHGIRFWVTRTKTVEVKSGMDWEQPHTSSLVEAEWFRQRNVRLPEGAES